MPNGGNPEKMDVNAQWAGFEFHYVYQVIMGMLVFLIVPGIGLLYGGMARRKSALAMIFQSMSVHGYVHVSMDLLGIFNCLLSHWRSLHWPI